jgi:flagellar motor component MotA
MFLIGVILFLLIINSTIFLFSNSGMPFNLLCFLFVLLSNIAILITSKSITNFIYGIKLLTFKNGNIKKEKVNDSIEIFNLLIKSSFFICFIGIIMGFIIMQQHLSDPSSIGPNMTLTSLILFYSIILDLIILIPGKYLLSKITREIEK